jgi:malate dehydrogenase (oxaloacetate-decarboxylating)
MPVMEGKALLFKQFGHIDAWPICLDTKDTELIIQTVKLLAPSFGGINLEDISAPRCFIIEDRLKNEMDIPVMHDDQHGTAVVVLAALINACKITNKPINKSKIVILGAGAASSACAKILIESGAEQIILLDRQGILHKQRSFEDNPMKHWLAQHTNPSNLSGSLDDALRNADIFLGMSGPNLITRDQILTMSPNPIIFALSNPDPEILPSEIDDIASIIATGRSDFPNQVNNALCFPGIFRGALNVRATIINEEMKLAAAQAIASYIPDHSLNKNYIIPNIFELGVAEAVAEATMKAATSSGVARVSPINTK